MVNYLELGLILIIVALGLWVLKLYVEKKESEREAALAEKEKDEYVQMGRGLAEYNQKLQERKNQVKAKILEMLAKSAGGRISNRDIAQNLGIGRISVIRYLDELEKEGKAKQVGKSGRKVFYEAK